jgi:hypothetical protein
MASEEVIEESDSIFRGEYTDTGALLAAAGVSIGYEEEQQKIRLPKKCSNVPISRIQHY